MYEDQRSGMQALARKLATAGVLKEGWRQPRATAALRALTSVETFTLLRRGLTLAQVQAMITRPSLRRPSADGFRRASG